MKTLLFATALALASTSYGSSGIHVVPNALSNEVVMWEQQDQLFQEIFPEDYNYFQGALDFEAEVIPFLEEEGMFFVTDWPYKVDEEDVILRVVSNLNTILYFGTPGDPTYEYYRGQYQTAYNLLSLMNNWPNSGAAVPGTYYQPFFGSSVSAKGHQNR